MELKTFTNPDEEYVAAMKKELKEYSHYCGYLPKAKPNKCPCREFTNQECEGWCRAKLYYKKYVEGEEDV